MKKQVFTAALAAGMICASVSPQALLRQYETPQPTAASPAEGSQLYPASTEPARFVSVNSQYNTAADSFYLSFTNNSSSPVTLTGEGNLEIEKEWKQYLVIPRHGTAFAPAAESGISGEARGRSIAPGETFLFSMYVGHYKPVRVDGASTPFMEGRYRVSVEVIREDGSAYQWACLPFRIVTGEVQADQQNVTVSVSRAAYSPRTISIGYMIENHSGGDLWYGGGARLQRLSGDRWSDVAGSEQVSGDLRQLASGASDAGVITVSGRFNLSPGTYRAVKTVAGLDLASGQFTVPGDDALRLPIEPVQVSVDWYALDETERVKLPWWTRTKTGRDIWLTADDLYDGQSAPEAILRELEAFQLDTEPTGYSKENLADVTLWDAGQNNLTATLIGHSTGTYCLVDGKWYKTGDTHVLDRIKTALDAVSGI